MAIQGDQVPVPLVSNTAEGDVSGQERLVNVYPRATTGGKYPFNLINTPGIAQFLNLPTFPVLGLHRIKSTERGFAVTPTKLYEINSDGTYSEIGDVLLSGERVVMESNGRHLVMVDGVRGYYYDSQGGALNQFAGDGWYPARTVTYQDGYFLFERKDTGQFFISNILDTTFDSLDIATAEGQPDNLLAVISDHREVFMFGGDTIEVWYNSGDADFPFERNQGAFIEKGCAAPYSIAKQNNTIYFIGSDLMVYEMAGYTPIRISNHAVEQTLKNTRLSDAFAYVMHDEGHLFYVLTIPSQNITWRLDISTRSWHEMQDYQFTRHRSNCVMVLDGKTLVGDFQSGQVFILSREHFFDDGQPLVRQFVLPVISNGREFFTLYSFELDLSAGVGLIDGQGSDPMALLEFSKDGGKTWSNYKQARIGKIGEYLNRVKWNRLGVARQFTVRVTISDPVPIDIGGAFIEAR